MTLANGNKGNWLEGRGAWKKVENLYLFKWTLMAYDPMYDTESDICLNTREVSS